MKKYLSSLLILLSINLFGQSWTNDFESYDSSVWSHLNIVDGVNKCLSNNEFNCEFSTALYNQKQSLNLAVTLSNTPTDAFCVVSVNNDYENLFWKSFTLASNNKWNENHFEVFLPHEIINNNRVVVYIWNPNKKEFLIDNINISLTPIVKSFVPTIDNETKCTNGKVLAKTNYAQIIYSNTDNTIIISDKNNNPICLPISMLTQFTDDNDTLTIVNNKWQPTFNKHYLNNSELTLVNDNDICKTSLTINCNDWHFGLHCRVKTTFHKTTTIIRQSLIIPFVDNNFTIYRQCRKIDKDILQDEYYLDTEGFEWNNNDCQFVVYHPQQLSSIQLNTVQKTAFFNIDYYLDHPLIYYPLSNDTSDYFIDCSAVSYTRGSRLNAQFDINIGWNTNLIPRIMALPNGFNAAFIWTEHADWTDLATHRAVNFGSELVTDYENAVEGFAAHNIPVTKSVFFNNPDNVTNADNDGNTFASPIATIKTDENFYHFLKQLKNKGFDICLHTPEIYTTNKENLIEALSFMEKDFCSQSWIDHGYNNGSSHNREDMICDGLNKESSYYALNIWKQHGIKYLWNAYYEEVRPFEQFCFDNNLMQPYPGSSDALPFKQFFNLQNDNSFTCWSTTSTLEVDDDNLWNYYLSDKRLMELVDYKSIYIAHTYPSWTNPNRGFWTTDENRTVIIKPQFEKALQNIASLRDKGLLLTCTIPYLLNYQSLIKNVRYEFTPESTIKITNNNEQIIEGFSLISSTPLSFSNNKQFEQKNRNNEIIYWFKLNPKEELILSY